jgi:hypothetical protein
MDTSGNYKFKHLKVFGSTENLYDNEKKYRKVYDEQECRYMYAELAIFNKLFDEQDWEVEVKMCCKNTANESVNICELTKTHKVSKETNILYVREGWGTPNTGWWKAGKYSE